MGSRLGRRVVYFANLPIKLQMPSTLTNIREIALRTIPSASKIEIKRVLESLYGFEVDKVRTLNMEGKKKQRGGLLIARPDYKKAYVTLKSPLSISPDWFPTRFVEEERERTSKTKKAAVVDDGKKHWLDERKEAKTGYGPLPRGGIGSGRGSGGRCGRGSGSGGRRGGEVTADKAKFPWSSMRNDASASSSSSSSSR